LNCSSKQPAPKSINLFVKFYLDQYYCQAWNWVLTENPPGTGATSTAVFCCACRLENCCLRWLYWRRRLTF
jgi:hypothetical protein